MTEKQVYKIFCDESCHLQHDGADIMVLGALHCTAEKATQLNKHIKWLRHEHNYHNELKWTKLVTKQWPFYKALIDLVIDTDELRFKTTVVQQKNKLNHDQYNAGSHNNFYYKMFYYTLRDFLEVNGQYRIYLDYMDTLGGEKVAELCRVLQNSTNWHLDVDAFVIQSYEAQLIQICDLLIGAVSYQNRTDIEHSSEIKQKIVDYLQQRLGYLLNINTPPWEAKFNIFRFMPRSV